MTEQSTVANITASKPVNLGNGAIRVTGTALNADRTAMSVDELEQRLVNPAAVQQRAAHPARSR